MLANRRQCIMRCVYTLSLSSLLISSTGFTAAPSWQGFYVGAYTGGAVANNRTSTDVGTVTGSSYFTTNADINAVANSGSSTNVPDTLLAGIQAGHDWVWKQMVYGLAADYSVLPLRSTESATKSYPDNTNTYSIYTSTSTNWLFTLRGRVGQQVMVYWPGLVYFTGGMAMTKLRVNNNFSDNSSSSGIGGNNASENQIGWTAGLGLELASYEHATVDLEYMYVRIPSVKATGTISNSAAGFGVPANSLSSPFTSTGDFYASLLRIGLNYRF